MEEKGTKRQSACFLLLSKIDMQGHSEQKQNFIAQTGVLEIRKGGNICRTLLPDPCTCLFIYCYSLFTPSLTLENWNYVDSVLWKQKSPN